MNMNKPSNNEDLGTLYPDFQEKSIDELSEDQFDWPGLITFPFRVKGRRKDDLVVFLPGNERQSSKIILYENPDKKDYARGSVVSNVSSKKKWKKKVLAEVNAPTSCLAIDISRNGFSDIVITADYGESPDAMSSLGGKSLWMENSGTGEGMWETHDIGRYPGLNLMKAGHFSTTFSTQLLASVTSSDPGVSSPFVIFTRPEDIYQSKQWFVTKALPNTLHAIQGYFVVKGANGLLDYLIVSSREGLSVVWYHALEWHSKLLTEVPVSSSRSGRHHLGQIHPGQILKDATGYIVSSSSNKGGLLYVFKKQKPGDDPRSTTWSLTELDNFSTPDGSGSIQDLLCADIDEDGIDEIYISVSGPVSVAGLYCYEYEQGSFTKYKLSNNSAVKLAYGHFSSPHSFDLAYISFSRPQRLSLLCRAYKSSSIRPTIEDSELIFSIPRSPSMYTVCEIDILTIMGYTLSLVTLPPNSFSTVSVHGCDAIKVLHGVLGWVDDQSELIERSRATGPPGCVTSMLVDSSDGHVRSGNDGAVFVRLRPTTTVHKENLYDNPSNSWKQVTNVIPEQYPYDIQKYEFKWRDARGYSGSSSSRSGTSELLELLGFHVRFEDPSSNTEDPEPREFLANVYFSASAPNFTMDFAKHNVTPWPLKYSAFKETCSIHSCLSNPGGNGGLLYCEDGLDWGHTPPTSYQITRARKVIVPEMYEHAPFWRATKHSIDDDEKGSSKGDGETEIEYPWHAWAASKGTQKRQKWDVSLVFDFPTFVNDDQLQARDTQNECVIA